MNSSVKKLLAVSAVATALCSSLFAVEYSAVITDDSKVKFVENDFTKPLLVQKESLSASLKIPFSSKGGTYLISELYAEHDLNANFISQDYQNNVIVDLSLLKFSSLIKFNYTTNMTLNLGRFGMSDLTGLIFNQNCDGAFINFTSPGFKFSLYGGYTGLLNAKAVSILNSKGDVYSTENIVYGFASPYATAEAYMEFSNIIGKNALAIEGLAFHGLPGFNKEAKDESSRIYGTLLLNGPVVPNIFYSASTTVGITDYKDFSNLSKLSFTLYTNFCNSTVTLSGVYASGNNGVLKAFNAFTKTNSTLANNDPALTSIVKGGLSASILPVSNLYMTIGGNIIFDCPENEIALSGYEAAFLLDWQIFSDLDLKFGTSAYLGNGSTAANNVSANLALAIAF